MSLQDVLARGRAAAAARMLDTCRVTRASGDLNRSTGLYDAAPQTIYEGPCRLVLPSPNPSRDEAQSQILTTQRPRLDLPITAPTGSTGDPANVTTDDVAEILTSPTDPTQVGTRLRVAGEHTATQMTARRLPMEVVTGD